jgi:hypothetical protein
LIEPLTADLFSGTFLFLARFTNEDHTRRQETLLRGSVAQTPMEESMRKGFITIAATLAVVSLASLVTDRAQAGGASSAPSKYSYTTVTVKQAQVRRDLLIQASDVRITEFSSSSAKSSAPKR